MTKFIIRTPDPHAKQKGFQDSLAKRKVIVAGRRGGKTTGMAILAADKAMDGRRVLEAAPTADQTGAFWDAVKKYFADPIAAGVVYKNETDRLIELPNGGRIRCKTAHDADTLRGDYADLLILDEYEMMKPNAWDEVGAPMLLDNDGDAVFIGTPMRKNHFFKMYARAQSDDTGRWEAWKFTSYDNPHLSKDALEEITFDMTQEAYRQEILAEFLDNDGAVFHNIGACMNAPIVHEPYGHHGHYVVMGVDWGQMQDHTAVSVGCTECMMELFKWRVKGMDYPTQQAKLFEIVKTWKPKIVLAETNAMGLPIIQQLRKDGMYQIQGFDTTPSTKPQLIRNLALSFERAEWQFQDDPVWTSELEAYEEKVSKITGRSQFSAPDGVHDDTVIARALMAWAGIGNASLPVDMLKTESKYELDQPESGSRWRKY